MRISSSARLSAALVPVALGAAMALAAPASAQSIRTSQLSGTTSTTGGIAGTPTGTSSGGTSSSGTQLRATEGSSSIGSTNVDALARSGDIGTSPVDTLGTSGDPMNSNYSAQLAPVQTPAPELPTPRVGIDLEAIQRGLASAPSATPDAAGN
ncbi:hypothetical protein [Jiella avicenniae]|uniref:Uncharacterized protein n=1 Tax=Jiella avicenniae TaxID=2907202 RepID=A0A9X1P1Z4_9HYPH|nr:hypothetical protein [Jiella avicenniae]MCE7027873.1 hypothetical protein [Jiella avicenniae]